MSALHRMSLAEMGRALRRRQVSPCELLDDVLAQHDRVNPVLNAVVALDRQAARAAARASEKRFQAGTPLGPLDGVPITIKDNLLVKGLPATWGSEVYKDFVPVADELPVAKLRSQGAIIVGKTNVPEFTLQGYTSNRLFGPTRNAWATTLTPGGSSGGAVAAVAAGIGPVALGTDGGGSTRRPAGFTRLVGLKPSTGSIARHGGFPEILYDLEVIGIIGRTVDAVRLAYDALAGPDRRDRRSWMAPGMPQATESLRPGNRYRIKLVTAFGDAPVEPPIVDAVRSAAQSLAELGCDVEEGAVSFSVEETTLLLGTIFAAGLARIVGEQSIPLSESLLPLLEEGRRLHASAYAAAIERLWELRRESEELFGDHAFIMTPTSAAMPWPCETPYPRTIAGSEAGPRGHAVYTGFVNLFGLPGLSLPAPVPKESLPIGFQLVGRFGSERAILALAQAYEAHHPWAEIWPAAIASPGDPSPRAATDSKRSQ